MASCKTISRPANRICIGDLKSKVTLYVRQLTQSNTGLDDVDYAIAQNTEITVFARIDTTRGGEYFDGVNQNIRPTHRIYIRWRTDLDISNGVLVNGERLKVLNFYNLNEENRFAVIECTNRGDENRGATLI